MNYYEHHIFFCLNIREDGEQCCTQMGSEKLFNYMKSKIKSLDIRGKGMVRVNRAGCFDRCSEGPLLVIYPQGIWYRFIDEKDIDEIIASHILAGKPVERLLV